jgi:hypothetical protein
MQQPAGPSAPAKRGLSDIGIGCTRSPEKRPRRAGEQQQPGATVRGREAGDASDAAGRALKRARLDAAVACAAASGGATVTVGELRATAAAVRAALDASCSGGGGATADAPQQQQQQQTHQAPPAFFEGARTAAAAVSGGGGGGGFFGGEFQRCLSARRNADSG